MTAQEIALAAQSFGVNQTPAPKWSEPDMVGVHNADLAKSTIRILEGASWKRQETVILIPAARTVATKIAMSWMNLITPPNQSAPKLPSEVFGVFGMEVGEAYSTAIERILQTPQLATHKYILTLEHDNAPPPGGLLRLIAHMDAHPEFACIGGLYWTKGPEGVPQIWGDPKDALVNFRPQPPDPKGGLVECCGTGMGFNLWRMEMFRDPRLRRPWFKTLSGDGGVSTQDLYAWADFRKFGYRCAIACDVKVGHYDLETDTMW